MYRLFCRLLFFVFTAYGIPLSAADIPQGVWTRSTRPELSELFGQAVYIPTQDQSGIRCKDAYIPQQVDTAKRPAVLIVVHGTWAQDASEYYHPDSELYGGLRTYAQLHADRHNVPIEIISFRWTGSNFYVSRRDAAEVLSTIINKHYAQHEIITLAHSHGCNIVNNASHKLENTIILEHIINMATPVREAVEAECKPNHFKRLTQFYSTSDWVAVAGAVVFGKYYVPALGGHLFSAQSDRVVVNLRTQINGLDPGHSSIKLLVKYLSTILDAINTQYRYHADLDLDIHLDTEVPDPVLLSIRHPLTVEALLSCAGPTDTLVQEMNALAVLRAIRQEIDYSTAQEGIFNERYKRNMHVEASLIVRLGRGFGQDFASELMPLVTRYALIGGIVAFAGLLYCKLIKRATPVS